MKVLIARDIVKYHGGDLEVLSGTTLAIEAGEKLGLVGRNGAGKTTMMRILAGDSQPDEGSVELVGNARVGLTSQSLYAGKLGTRSIEEEISSAFDALRERESELKELEIQLSENPSDALMERYGRLQTAFERDGGYEYQSRAAFVSGIRARGLEASRWIFLRWRAEPGRAREAVVGGAGSHPTRRTDEPPGSRRHRMARNLYKKRQKRGAGRLAR
jgi:ATP-binding cassette subfamily F protein 3